MLMLYSEFCFTALTFSASALSQTVEAMLQNRQRCPIRFLKITKKYSSDLNLKVRLNHFFIGPFSNRRTSYVMNKRHMWMYHVAQYDLNCLASKPDFFGSVLVSSFS